MHIGGASARTSGGKVEMGIGYKLYRWIRDLQERIYTQIMREALLSCGEGVKIARSAIVERPEKIRLGQGCAIYEGAKLVGSTSGECGIDLGRGTAVREYAHVNAYGGFIRTGSNVFIGHGSIVCGHGGLVIGENTLIAGLCYLIPANHVFASVDIPLRFQGEERRGIRIGANVWIGSGVSVLDGVEIGEHAIVGAGSVVTKDIPPWSLAYGIPASVIRSRLDEARIGMGGLQREQTQGD